MLLRIDIPNSMDFQITSHVQLEQMFFLISAWSYILFFKWTELLQDVDETATIQNNSFEDDIDFRNMISKR